MKNKIISLILLAILIFPTYKFFLGKMMFTFNDETQIANFHQYFKAIDLGQFPPRWATDMHFEYGSPLLSFNYQLPYYVGYLGHLLGLPITVIYKLLLILSFLFGALGMYLLGTSITGSNLISVFAGVLYTYTPYQSIDHYVRGAIGESFALALLPWLFYSCLLLVRKNSSLRQLVTGLIFGLIIISHQPAALFTIPIFAILFGSAALLTKKPAALFGLTKSTVLGLALSAYYWVPVILEKSFIQASSPFNYISQFPFLWQLVYSRWTYTGANPFSNDTFSFQIGIVNLITLAIALIVLLVSTLKKFKASLDLWFLRLTVIAIFGVIFLMNIRSDFIWRGFPLMQVIQFPWRLLMFTTLFTSVLYLFVIKYIPKPWNNRLTLLFLISSIFINAGYFRPGLIIDHDDRYFLHRFLPRAALQPGESISASYLQNAEDYVPLPTKAVRPKNLPAAKLTSQSIATGIKVTKTNPFSYHARVDNQVSDVLTYHAFYYPGWEVKVDGFPTKINPDVIGAITFELSPGQHEVDILFTDTPVRLLSNIISLGALAFTSTYLVYYLSKRRVTPTA